MSKAESSRIAETLLAAIVTTVKKGGSLVIAGFGSFKQHARAARNGVNAATGAESRIAAVKLSKFTPGTGFKAAVDPKAAARKAARAGATRVATAPEKKKVRQACSCRSDWSLAQAAERLGSQAMR